MRGPCAGERVRNQLFTKDLRGGVGPDVERLDSDVVGEDSIARAGAAKTSGTDSFASDADSFTSRATTSMSAKDSCASGAPASTSGPDSSTSAVDFCTESVRARHP